MGVGVKVNVWGDYALFSRPELKVERYSYDIITPSAARGILEAIYWHPGMRWIIDKIYVKNSVYYGRRRLYRFGISDIACKGRHKHCRVRYKPREYR